MKAYGAAGQLQKAVCLLDEMKEAKVHRAFSTWRTIIDIAHAENELSLVDDLYEVALTSSAVDPYKEWRDHDDPLCHKDDRKANEGVGKGPLVSRMWSDVGCCRVLL